MNTLNRFPRLLVLGAFALATGAAGAAQTPASTRVHVEWPDVATLSEIREAHGRGGHRSEALLADLRTYIVRAADRTLAPGDRLELTITDIKLAGAYEPGRGPQYDDVRVVKDIYPPRIDLRFTLTGPDGEVLASGERKLRDPAFLSRTLANGSDPLRHEKRLLDDWLRELAGERRGS